MVIDLTLPLRDRLDSFPGDAPTRIRQVHTLARNGYTNSVLSTGMHSGTHIDGSQHLTDDSRFMEDLPPERFIGRGCVLNAAGGTTHRSTEGI